MYGAGMGDLCGILLKKKRDHPFRWVEERYVKCEQCKEVFFLEFDQFSETNKLRLIDMKIKGE